MKIAPFLRPAATLSLGLALLALPACEHAFSRDAAKGDAVADMLDKNTDADRRLAALDEAWADVKSGVREKQAVRNATKDIIWKSSAPAPLRIKALGYLVNETDPADIADTRHLLILRLPTENSWPMVEAICKAIQEHAADKAGGWQDQTASLVWSYSRKVPQPEDKDRPERAALLALHPGEPLNQIVLNVFINPAQNGAPPRPTDWPEKSRRGAWELLSRLDPTGSERTALLASHPDVANEPALQELRKAATELGVVPITASELAWLHHLADPKDPADAQWWSQTAAIVAKLTPGQRSGLMMRNLEPLRWAAAHHPEWLTAERESLLTQLESRLAGRRIHRKTDDEEGNMLAGEQSKETPKEWAEQLTFGDLIAILVVDDAVHDPSVIRELFQQAAADRADETTEYGGLLWASDEWKPAAGAKNAPTTEGFVARGYVPRPVSRVNDRTFIAPEEMFRNGSRSLAHYHFHVQTYDNSEYAGPGRGDLKYTDEHGRSCVVFTSVSEGVLDADYYERGGVVIDLGEIRK